MKTPSQVEFTKLVLDGKMTDKQKAWIIRLYHEILEFRFNANAYEFADRDQYRSFYALVRPATEKADVAFARIFPGPENEASCMELADGELAPSLDIALERLARIALLFTRPGMPAQYGTKFSK